MLVSETGDLGLNRNLKLSTVVSGLLLGQLAVLEMDSMESLWRWFVSVHFVKLCSSCEFARIHEMSSARGSQLQRHHRTLGFSIVSCHRLIRDPHIPSDVLFLSTEAKAEVGQQSHQIDGFVSRTEPYS